MTLRSSFIATLALVLLNSCGQTQNPEVILNQASGLIEINFTGVGTQNLKATAINRSNPQTRSISDLVTGIQLEPISNGSFEVGTRGVDGIRYLSASFKVRNAHSCTPVGSCTGTAYNSVRHNLTFMAVSTSATINQTAVANLKLFDGSPTPTLASSILPTHGMGFDGLNASVHTGLEDFQAFTEAEVSSLTSPGVTSVFPYGFVTRCVNNCVVGTRDLAVNPQPNQFDGRVTFAAKIPLQTLKSADPFSFSLMFEAVDDNITRVTQSLEEQSNPSLVTTRANALTGATIARLPDGTNTTPTLTCALRTAGTSASPLTFLVLSPALNAVPILANQMFANSGSVVTSNYNQAMNLPTPSNFSVQGSMTGLKNGTYSKSGNNISFNPNPANFNPAGEELEVTLTTGLSSITGLKTCQGQTYKYRTTVTPNTAGTFGIPTSVNTGFDPQAVAVGDANNDGKLDVFSADMSNSTLTVLIQNAIGFAAAVHYVVGTSPTALALGDLNSDGNIDLLTANFANNVSVLLGNGDGTFANALNLALGFAPQGIKLGDVNSDGKLDLVTGNSSTSSIVIRLGNGDGSFQASSSFANGASPFALDLADINHDFKLDVIVANAFSNDLSLLLGNGDGSFQTAQNISAGTTPNMVLATDLNNDGNLDLLNTNQNSNSVMVRLGNGNGSFQAVNNIPLGSGQKSMAIGDVNGDGKLDLLSASKTLNTVSILLGDGLGGFGAAANYNLPNLASAVVLADMNNDGKLDILSSLPVLSTIAQLLQP